jgi:hypothetical protein
MKATLTLIAVPLMMGVAFAQASGSGSPAETKTETKTATSSDKAAEMKTMKYKGTLVDLACGGGSANTASAAASDTAKTDAASANSANRSAGDASGCPVSANTTTFGLKTDAGQTYRFDMVGNQRATDEMKNNKGWNKKVSGNQPFKVSISGVVQGDKLIVSSIH